MCGLLMLFATLLHATSTVNALECLTGFAIKINVTSEKASNKGNVNPWNLMECRAGIKHCMKMTCTLDDAEALRELSPKRFPDGTVATTTGKGCLATAGGKCELPDEFFGVDLRKAKKYCGVSCCTGNACNGTLGLRSFGTVAAMIAFVAAFFLHWN